MLTLISISLYWNKKTDLLVTAVTAESGNNEIYVLYILIVIEDA